MLIPRGFWRPSSRGGVSCTGQIDQGYPVVACTHGCSVKCGIRVLRSPAQMVPDVSLRMVKCNNQNPVHEMHSEYEDASATGETLYVPRPKGFGEAGLDLGNLIEDMGLTAWCYGTWYRYLGALRAMGIQRVLGEPIELDDPGWWRDWIVKVAHRRGVGNEFAEGLARFYDRHRIGPSHLAEFVESAGSRGHGWHRDGRAMEAEPSPFWEYAALLYAVSTRDVTPSTHGFFFLGGLTRALSKFEGSEEVVRTIRDFAERLYGVPDALYPGNEHIAQVTAWHQYRSVIKDSMGVCDWVFPALRRTLDTGQDFEEALRSGASALWGDPSAEAVLYRASTGIELDMTEMERPIAERIVNLERCIDVRNTGRDRAVDEVVIPHFQWPEKTDGTHISPQTDEFRALLDQYYALRGWDRVTGCPSEERLRALGLEGVANALHAQAMPV